MRVSVLPLFVLLLPFLEIAGFIVVGKAIGVLATLGLTIATSLIGVLLLRHQGLGLLKRLSSEGQRGVEPGRELVHGAMIVIAGFLLLLPGFVTDIIGLLFFLPPVRDLAWKLIGSRMVVMTPARGFSARGFGQGSDPFSGARGPGKGPVVDLDEDDFHRDPDSSSPWSNDPRIGPK